jgi:hypothetical protein
MGHEPHLLMPVAVLLKALVLWIGILVLAILNGALREKTLIPAMGTFGALIASGIVLSVCIGLVAFFAAPWYSPLPSSQYWLIGLFWLILTLLFEFSFGRFVQHKDWTELLQAYTFKGGNIWPVVLAVTLLSPWLAARLRGVL